MNNASLIAWLTAITTLIAVLGNLVLQLIQATKSTENGKKIDENTALTKEAAKKIEEVHAVTDILKAVNGNHDVLESKPTTQEISK